jgi:hypothetical protein
MTIDKFYESLRYPLNKKLSKNYEYYELKYNEERAIPFFKETAQNINKLKPMVVSLSRSLKDQNKP